ncbi:hypothetical protein J2X54_000857 [Duganella sp. 3397]|uniref:hypothetical protein n=1 Tax=Duganella sp. 3397 TaxID=2817732 RepID=UPI0028584708|nr:hypothetical protein [Duganella sp. 3397]MDR7048422.1 hypothetical protein [Duganella sp. 3397]
MDDEQLVKKILQSLIELEQQGELVLTTNASSNVARYILDSALKQLVTAFRDSDEPMECTMPYLLEQTVDDVKKWFGVPSQRAQEITGSYYNRLLERLTVEKIAELYWHETPSEMAKRSYYRVELGRDDSEFEYLDWRRKY